MASTSTAPPVEALVSTLASTCPAVVDEGRLHLPSPHDRAVFDTALRSAIAAAATDAAEAGAPLMEHAPAGGGGAPGLPRLLDLAVSLGGSGAVDQGANGGGGGG